MLHRLLRTFPLGLLGLLLLAGCISKTTTPTSSGDTPTQVATIEPHVDCVAPYLDGPMKQDSCRVIWGTEDQKQVTEPFAQIEFLGMKAGKPLYLAHHKMNPFNGYTEIGGNGLYVGHGNDYLSGPWLMVSREAETDGGALIPDSDPDNFLWIVDGKPLFVGITEVGDQLVWGNEVGPAFYHIVPGEGIRIVDGKLLYIGVHLQGSDKGYRAVWGDQIDEPHTIVTRLSVIGGKMAYTALDDKEGEYLFQRQQIVWGDTVGPVWNGTAVIDGLVDDGRLAYRVRLPPDEDTYDENNPSTWTSDDWVETILGEESPHPAILN